MSTAIMNYHFLKTERAVTNNVSLERAGQRLLTIGSLLPSQSAASITLHCGAKCEKNAYFVLVSRSSTSFHGGVKLLLELERYRAFSKVETRYLLMQAQAGCPQNA